ncbi:hypothetical protein P152DRAFT_460656 [Eremomyces bilateralis CBS 781.70]|uniref:Uncharacterized protein n=1 Tax=Eremomyces bilateralis CBS 781.70 TaxID=1392243 RepID=A0A6G1FXV8_9PEZI|nr:uncharacterized protein P152DRAFT_460656 [Eremomyces bilateralis CBS 781.70]KAF1810521.1 hypothetical protein P152DRAFT_460656 [Eremomyces bilateralis CBS 781.70]
MTSSFKSPDRYSSTCPSLSGKSRSNGSRTILMRRGSAALVIVETEDLFYYRIQSPVVVVEFDHHLGVFLRNTEPEMYHIYTIQTAPNGGEYGSALHEANYRLGWSFEEIRNSLPR